MQDARPPSNDAAFPSDRDEIARIESHNAFQQFDAVTRLVRETAGAKALNLQPSHILELNRLAIQRLSPEAGAYRTKFVTIQGSLHEPPSPVKVAALVAEMCAFVNDNWSKPATFLASYVLWRIGWIHPFADGNGRTARAAAYIVLCVRLGFLVNGQYTVVEQLAENKQPCFDALEAADHAWQSEKRIDVRKVEFLLGHLLAKQIGEAEH